MSWRARWLRCGVGAVAVTLAVAAGASVEAAEPRRSPGCGSEPSAEPGTSTTANLEFESLDREYRLHLPTGYDAGQPLPLVLVIHGYTGTAVQTEEQYTTFSQQADKHGFLAAYPQGTGFDVGGYRITSWNDLACNASPGPEGPTCTEDADDYPTPPECGEPRQCDWCSCYDDVGFIAALLEEIQRTHCVDLDRVYATGISNGGMFVQRLGCDLADRFAAVAPVAGALAKGFNCAGPKGSKVSMLNIHGTEDRTVPADGSPASDGFLYTPASQVVDAWAAETSQGCAAEESAYKTTKDGVAGLRCTQRAACRSGAEVVDCSWEGGHTWPRHEGEEFGVELIWQFFDKNGR